jgi:hypothetical protein
MPFKHHVFSVFRRIYNFKCQRSQRLKRVTSSGLATLSLTTVTKHTRTPQKTKAPLPQFNV